MSKARAKSRNHLKVEECCDYACCGSESGIDVMRPNPEGKVVVLTTGFQVVEKILQAAR